MDYDGVIATNDDAAICKYHAVRRGYYRDPFISKLLPSSLISSSTNKAPEINLGYYARSISIAYIVEEFIIAHPRCQIINLGAGYDTLYWRLKECCSRSPELRMDQVKFIEIDLLEVTTKKMMSINRQNELKCYLSSPIRGEQGLYDRLYNLLPFDLSRAEKSKLEEKLTTNCDIDYSLHTLCITECMLIYLPIRDSHNLISWFSGKFTNLTMLNYEQCDMGDKFGEVMLTNMNARHCDLMGVEACQSLGTQMGRFKDCGLSFTKAWKLMQIFESILLPSEVERVYKLESLDEKELLNQLLDHYCIVLASSKELDWLNDNNYWFSRSCRIES